MQLFHIAELLKIEAPLSNPVIQSVCIDSRLVKPGDLFIALEGKTHDSHNFLSDVEKKGAVAAILSKKISLNIPTLTVTDTIEALGKIAQYNRTLFTPTVISLTGSVGKTTTKEMIAHILKQKGNTLYSQKNFNNHIGVPLTLLELNSSHKFLVLEMGANHKGEIAYLTRLASPHIALITNVAEAHLEGFGNLEGVMHAKSEIFQSVPQGGLAIINGDDTLRASFFKKVAPHLNFLTFGFKDTNHFYAENIICHSDSSTFDAITPGGSIHIHLPLLGRHNVINALGAIAATFGLVPLSFTKAGLEQAQPVNGRLHLSKGLNGAHIIDDSYNANPYSTSAALNFLSQQKGEKIFVFGGMVELGSESEELHRNIGILAKQLGIEKVFTVGTSCRATNEAFGSLDKHFSDKTTLIENLKNHLKKDTFVLIKGSRFFQMEQIAHALLLQNP